MKGGGEAMKRKIAEGLLKIKAVTLQPNNPFTWAALNHLFIVTTA